MVAQTLMGQLTAALLCSGRSNAVISGRVALIVKSMDPEPACREWPSTLTLPTQIVARLKQLKESRLIASVPRPSVSARYL